MDAYPISGVNRLTSSSAHFYAIASRHPHPVHGVLIHSILISVVDTIKNNTLEISVRSDSSA